MLPASAQVLRESQTETTEGSVIDDADVVKTPVPEDNRTDGGNPPEDK